MLAAQRSLRRPAVHFGARYSSSSANANFYNVLDVTPGASKKEVKAAYYRLSKLNHPDVNASPEAHTQFLAISDAYAVLGNDAKRRQYDMQRISRSSAHLRTAPHRTPRGAAPPPGSRASYGAYDPTSARRRPPPPGGRDPGRFDYNAHDWEHYGREEAEMKRQQAMRSTRHQEKDEAKRQKAWEDWQRHLQHERSETGYALGVGASIIVLMMGAAFWSHF